MNNSRNGNCCSLYVCDFPQQLERADLTNAFRNFSGFLEARIAKDKTGQKISFVDFSHVEGAVMAMKQMRGHKFNGSNRGLNLRISDKS